MVRNDPRRHGNPDNVPGVIKRILCNDVSELLRIIAILKLRYVHIEPPLDVIGPPLTDTPIRRRQYLTTRFKAITSLVRDGEVLVTR